MDVHPAAALFPMLGEIALSDLAEDIKNNGQAQPIIIWRGLILDGRNRLAACKIAGVEPITKDMSDLTEREAVRLVISVNVHRRHLTESLRAMITVELAKLEQGRQESNASKEALTQAEAAEAMNVSRSSVQRARQVSEADPELAKKVIKGEITVTKAAAIVKSRKAKMETDPDLADDSVVDASEQRAAEGDTVKARAVLAAVARLDPTELSFIKPDLLRILGVAK